MRSTPAIRIVTTHEVADKFRRHSNDRPSLRVLFEFNQSTADMGFLLHFVPHEYCLILSASSTYNPDVAYITSPEFMIVPIQANTRLLATLQSLNDFLDRVGECICRATTWM